MKIEEGQSCFQLGHIPDQNGQTLLSELVIFRNSQFYTIQVTTPTFLEELRRQNTGLDPAVQTDDKAFVLPDVSKPDLICEQLSQVPFEELEPYLTPYQLSEHSED